MAPMGLGGTIWLHVEMLVALIFLMACLMVPEGLGGNRWLTGDAGGMPV